MVKDDAKGSEIPLVRLLHVGNEGFRRNPGFFGRQHDRRAVGVVGAHKPGGVATQASRAHPDVGLDVTHQVAQVQGAVGIGQGSGNERGTGHGVRHAKGAGLSHALPMRPCRDNWLPENDSARQMPGRMQRLPVLAMVYSRTQVWVRQMKDTQPSMSSLLPPACSAILDL